MRYRKIPRISPGTYIFQKPFLRGLYSEGNLRFKIDWASLIVGSKFTVFALLYFVFEGNFPSTSTRGAHIWRGDLTEGFFFLGGGGGLFWEFYGTLYIILRHFGVSTVGDFSVIDRELRSPTTGSLGAPKIAI